MNRQSYYSDNNYETSAMNAMQIGDEAGIPVNPLPNPGEGGPVAGGPVFPDANFPVNPLPNPGEGGPVAGGPVFPDANTPVNPLPNPGEGGPVAGPGMRPPIFRPNLPGIGGIVTVIPGVTFPCFSCNNNNFGRVRFLNASNGYQPFYIYLGSWLVASQFGNGDMTNYLQAVSGTQTVTVAGAGGYVYVQKQIQVRSGASMTVAIINTTTGLDIMEISDISCNAPLGTSCLRTVNLSLNLGPFDVSIGSDSNFTPFTNVRYKEVTPYTSLYPGWYQIYISRTGTGGINVAYTTANMNANTSYTLYIFNAANATEGLKTMVVPN